MNTSDHLNVLDIILLFFMIAVIANIGSIIIGFIMEALTQLVSLLAWVGVIGFIIYLFIQIPK